MDELKGSTDKLEDVGDCVQPFFCFAWLVDFHEIARDVDDLRKKVECLALWPLFYCSLRLDFISYIR